MEVIAYVYKIVVGFPPATLKVTWCNHKPRYTRKNSVDGFCFHFPGKVSETSGSRVNFYGARFRMVMSIFDGKHRLYVFV